MSKVSHFIFIILVSLLFVFNSQAQVKLKGNVSDKSNKETMVGTNVVIKGTTRGTTTDIDGNFELEVDSLPVTLQISFVGYGKKDIKVEDAGTPLKIEMEMTAFAGQEVVVSASRVSETIMESAVSIQKMNSKQIEQAASGDFYQDLGNLQGVDITSASMGFKVINTRGFNTTSPVRSVQFIDGMDNQAPGLNFPIGNLMGASELDLESVELISGAASALYGPNAMQGVISMKSKNPYDYKGLSATVKGGSNNLLEGQFRYANTIDAKGRFAIKLNFAHLQANDWVADDTGANRYGDILVEDLNLSEILQDSRQELQDKKDAGTITEEELSDLNDLTALIDGYFDLVSTEAAPGKINIQAPGYMESQLADYNTRSTKMGVGLYYKLNDSLMASYEYKYGNGTAIYQGTNRYSINNIRFHQHKLELNGKNFFIRGYTTLENAGDSYDIVFTGINLSKSAVPDYVAEYLSAYLDSAGGIKFYSNGFDDKVSASQIAQAHSYAASRAEKMWYVANTAAYDSAMAAIIDNPDLQEGSKFVDASSLQHIEGQYNFNLKFADIIAGASFRRYDPNSYGTIFEDTLKNPGDTLANGQNDFNAEFVDITNYEYGGYTQITKRLLDNKLKIAGSVRFDVSKNYDLQFSPRLSAVYNVKKDHNFRIAGQSAFRSPTLQNQYLLIDLGPIMLTGNLNGSGNLSPDGSLITFYTLESVDEFMAMNDSVDADGKYVGSIQPGLLDTITLAPIKPEQVKSIELGYRGIIGKGLYVDLSGYYSVYSNFIASIRVVRPDGGAIAGEESGETAILAGTFERYQIPVNAKQSVSSYGGSIGLSYYFAKKYQAKANYTYAKLDTSKITDPIIPGFNTPEHKINIGLVGTKVWKELGFNTNLKWVDSFFWESSFGDGPVQSFYTLDIQLNYYFPTLYSTLRVGAANLLDNRHIEAYGAPMVGRLVYASWTFKFDDF